jgi:hypothetical protein
MSIARTAYCPNFNGDPDSVWIDARDVGDDRFPIPKFPLVYDRHIFNPWPSIWDPRLTKIRRTINPQNPENVRFYTSDQQMFESKLHFPPSSSNFRNNNIQYTPDTPVNRIQTHYRSSEIPRKYRARYEVANRYPQHEYEDYDPEECYSMFRT